MQLKDLEVWFQRESDVVRKLRSGDVDMGIVGYDVVAEFGEVGNYTTRTITIIIMCSSISLEKYVFFLCTRGQEPRRFV